MRHTRLLNAIGESWRSYNFTSTRLIGLFSLNVDLTCGVLTIMGSSAICFGTTGLSKLSLASACNRIFLIEDGPSHRLPVHYRQGSDMSLPFLLQEVPEINQKPLRNEVEQSAKAKRLKNLFLSIRPF